MVQYIDYQTIYTVGKRWFLYSTALAFPVTSFYDAPFGRFSTPDSALALDGIKSWIFMELVSPAVFLVTMTIHPFSPKPFPVPLVNSNTLAPQTLLAGLYLIHYLNRAIISPLRTPSRSKSHVAIVAAAVGFNTLNGFLLAAHLSSSDTAAYLFNAYSSPRFLIGIILWTLGLIGNIAHDEILLNIRRKAKAKGKAKEGSQPGEHYAIPQGGLYRYISYPNYFCEWVEWTGFALAAAPPPDARALPILKNVIMAVRESALAGISKVFAPFADSFAAPWAFLFAEVVTMLPRAIRGHQWYHDRFRGTYPRERRVVIPYLF
ncbi:hypothetical protein PENSPDRAFT_741875 [Peniophora sp. CONT]|nr:hypothetical protein PENSPDRAFT_741875 [Peniophora sp. CONT]